MTAKKLNKQKAGPMGPVSEETKADSTGLRNLGHVVSFHWGEELELDPSSNYQPHRHHHYSDGDGNCEVASPQAGGENRLIYAVDKRPQSTGKPSLKPQKNSQNRPARDAPLPFPMAQVAGQHQQRLHQRKQQSGNYNGGNYNGGNHAKKKK